MKTTTHERENYLAVVEAYYGYMLQKNFTAMGACLHPDVHFIGPLAELSGRDAVVEAAKRLSQMLADIHIRAKFATGDQIMLAYDFIFSGSIGKLRASVLMDFRDQQISKIELFYDARPFEDKRAEIFGR
ncbi:MAG: nuclear transport factor 2 family protein [Alphaproteobacteria bacterium]|nr:nuclear transport factor 2 family protein [Alphaproteobacteria bacterium]